MADVKLAATRERRDSDERPAPAVDRALDILEALAEQPLGLTLSELTTRLGLPKNAVFRITKTLLDREYLRRDASTLRFTLSGRWLDLGQPRVCGKTLGELASPVLRRVRDETRETIQLGVLSGEEGVIIEKLDGLHSLRISVDVGLRFPLYNNAPGKVLLAYSDAAERRRLIARMTLTRCTDRTIVDRGRLADECDLIRECGYSTDFAEADEGIHCVAAPVRDVGGQVPTVVWVSAPARRMPEDSFPVYGERMIAAAEEISRRLSLP